MSVTVVVVLYQTALPYVTAVVTEAGLTGEIWKYVYSLLINYGNILNINS